MRLLLHRNPRHPLGHSPRQSLGHDPGHPLSHDPMHPLSHGSRHLLSHDPRQPLSHDPRHPLSHNPKHPLSRDPRHLLDGNSRRPPKKEHSNTRSTILEIILQTIHGQGKVNSHRLLIVPLVLVLTRLWKALSTIDLTSRKRSPITQKKCVSFLAYLMPPHR